MVLCGTKNGSSMASLEEPFEAPLFLRSETGSEVGERGGDGIRKGPRARTRTRDARSATVLHVDVLPTRLSALI